MSFYRRIAVIVLFAAGLFFTSACSQKGIAIVSSAENEVTRRPADTEGWTAAVVEMQLYERDLVRTGLASAVGVVFDDGYKIDLGQKSQIIIARRPSGKKKDESTGDIKLESGSIGFERLQELADEGGSFLIETESELVIDVSSAKGEILPTTDGEIRIQLDEGEAAVNSGTRQVRIQPVDGRAVVDVRREDGIQLAMREGTAKIESEGVTDVVLEENDGMILEASGAVTSFSLPDPPLGLKAVSETSDFALRKKKVTASWSASVDLVSGYQLLAYETDVNNKPVTTIRVFDVSSVFPPVSAGDYQWTVRSLSPQGIAGKESDFSELTVYDYAAIPVPEPSVPEQDHEQVFKEQKAATEFSWQVSNVTNVYLEISPSESFESGTIVWRAEGNDSHTARLKEGTYYWRIAAIVGTNVMGAYGETRKLKLRRSVPPLLILTEPRRYMVDFDESFLVQGLTTPGQKVTIAMVWGDSKELVASSEGKFETRLTSRPGVNQIKVSANNQDGMSAKYVHKVAQISSEFEDDQEVQQISSVLDEKSNLMIRLYRQAAELRSDARSQLYADLVARIDELDSDIETVAQPLEAYFE